MRSGLTSLCFCFAAFAAWAGIAADGEIPAKADLEGGASEIQSILRDWAARRQELPTGKFDWILESENRSSKFGASFRDSHPGEDSTLEVFHLILDGGESQLQGQSYPVVQLVKTNGSWWGSHILRRRDKQSEFRVALESRFQRKFPVDRKRDYIIVRNAKEEVHFWPADGHDAAMAIVTVPGEVGRNLYNTVAVHTAPPWPVRSALLEAFEMAMHPRLLGTDPEVSHDVTLLATRPVVDGRRCLAIEERFLPERRQGSVSRTLWIDPAMENVVMRCVMFGQDGTRHSQYDFEYDQDPTGRILPKQITIMQCDHAQFIKKGFSDPYDQIRLTRSAFDLTTASPRPAFQIPSGCWVTDETTGDQFRIDRNGQRRSSPLGGHAGDDWRDWLVEFARKAVTWPGILISLPVCFVGVRVLSLLGERFRSSRREVSPTDSAASK